MIAEGADVVTVESYLGDSIEVTLKNYATSDPGAKPAARAFVEKGLGLDGARIHLKMTNNLLWHAWFQASFYWKCCQKSVQMQCKGVA